MEVEKATAAAAEPEILQETAGRPEFFKRTFQAFNYRSSAG